MTDPQRQPISDETLLGYILTALPQEELDELESRIASDRELHERVASLRELLFPLEESPQQAYEPSGDLVARTMSLVDACSHDRPLATGEYRASTGVPSGFTSVVESSNRQTRWAWIDSLAVVAAGVTLLCVLLPSIWYSREESRRMACSQNLRKLGSALHEFASFNAKGELPSIDIEGPLAFAGSYVLKLNDAQLLESDNLVWCPTQAVAPRHLGIPSMQQYLASSIDGQRSWIKTIGGSYAYHLGNIVDGNYQTPRIASRKIGDLPAPDFVPVVGDSVDLSIQRDSAESLPHASLGSNLLYNDGRVQTIRLTNIDESLGVDHPYLNRHHARAVGIGQDDTCLAPSFVPPVRLKDAWMITPASITPVNGTARAVR
jgi:hypothetical protein